MSGNSELRSPRNRRLQAKVGKRRNASARRSSLSARYPVNGAWPAEMRADLVAAYLDFRSVQELALAVSRGDAPPPNLYRGAGRSREAIWVKVLVDNHIAPRIASGRIIPNPIWQLWYEAPADRFEIASLLPPQAVEKRPLGIFL